ncbi:SGNH/GDSL hydrolase family protein [Bombilactobacillus thymidiniphilus]|uniref:Lysophospholipase L1-like esterase n=1 Tax=Bombilactobacillus thymidiniphilus TaxID=2923363 RepID=A0ABY4PCB3_9LACO|nr:hypothetical protein [Bombilactobacillus thymidiniphilus]UQS83199.1 hypothetical protein MOO47_05275 [Bombilactobacillus thymidiniphilus]
MKLQKTSANFDIAGLYFVGRWAHTEHGMYTSNLGAQIFTQLTDCAQIEFVFSTKASLEDTWLAYQIDDESYQRQNLTAGNLKIILPDKKAHSIRVFYSGCDVENNLWKRHEGLYFDKIIADKSAKLTPVKPVNEAIAFIGDSVSAGVRVKGTQAGSDTCSELSYAAQVANYFDASDIRIAYPGASVTHPGKGSVPKIALTLDKIDVSHLWQPIPSADVVINIGTNDQKANEQLFRVDFEVLMQKIKLLYPTSRLWVVIPLSQLHAQVIREETREYANAQVIETKDLDLVYTDGLHPDVASSKTFAKCVIDSIQTKRKPEY